MKITYLTTELEEPVHDKRNNEDICPCCAETINKLKVKFDNFIKNQKDCPKEFVDMVNRNFWNLI